MLDDRKTAILRAVVQEYIATAQPVGSSHIANTANIQVSSAQISGISMLGRFLPWLRSSVIFCLDLYVSGMGVTDDA